MRFRSGTNYNAATTVILAVGLGGLIYAATQVSTDSAGVQDVSNQGYAAFGLTLASGLWVLLENNAFPKKGIRVTKRTVTRIDSSNILSSIPNTAVSLKTAVGQKQSFVTDSNGKFRIDLSDYSSNIKSKIALKLRLQARNGPKAEIMVPSEFFTEYNSYLASLTPPKLTLKPTFTDKNCFSPNNILDGGEQNGEVILDILNAGEGEAFEPLLRISHKNAFIKIDSTLHLKNINPRTSTTLRIPITANLNIQDGELNIVLHLKEKRGYDSRPVLLKIPTRHLEKPKLKISYNVNDKNLGLAKGNGNLIPENDETIELIVKIQNVGKGISRDTKLRLSSISEGLRVVKSEDYLGDIVYNQIKYGKIVFEIPRDHNGSKLDFELRVNDKIGAIEQTHSFSEPMQQQTPILSANWNLVDKEGNRVTEIMNGHEYSLFVAPKNIGNLDAEDVVLTIATKQNVMFDYDNKSVGTVKSFESSNALKFTLKTARNLPEPNLIIDLILQQADFQNYYDQLNIPITTIEPQLSVSSRIVTGDGDQLIEVFEDVDFTLEISNKGELDANDVKVGLEIPDNNIDLKIKENLIGRIPAHQTKSTTFSFYVKNENAIGRLRLFGEITQSDGFPSIMQEWAVQIHNVDTTSFSSDITIEEAPTRTVSLQPMISKITEEERKAKTSDFELKGNENSLPNIIKKFFGDSRTWAVIIGIDDYSQKKNGYERLPFAVSDAESFRNSLVLNLNISQERIVTLYDSDANKRNIERLLGDELPRRISDNDRLLFYFSGHGETHTTPSGEFGFLIPIDGERSNLYSSCISMKQISDFSDLIPARQILFIVDACYSGIAGIINKGGREEEEKLRKVSEAQIRIFMGSRGRQILTAGTSKETARMGTEWDNHSVFTYYLLRGLKGEADYNQDNVISIFELQVYLNNNVAKDTESKQNPQLFTLGISEGQFVFYKEGEFD